MGNTTRTRMAEKMYCSRTSGHEHDCLAVDALNALIAAGHEYPDACLKIAARYGMNTAELTALYDNQ